MVKITPKNFWFWFGGIWLAVGLPFLAIGLFVFWSESALNRQLQREGKSAAGIVLMKRASGAYSTNRQFHVSYRFTADSGEVVESGAEVSRKVWDALREREPIAIAYLPSAPGRHRVPEQIDKSTLGFIFGGLGAVFSLLGGFVVAKAAAMRRGAERLEQEGIIAEATVIDVQPGSFSVNGVEQWHVLYRYRDDSGRSHEGQSPALDPDEAQRWRADDRVTVRYDRREPSRHVWAN